MADYLVTLFVKVKDIDDNHYFHEEPMDYLLETGIIENAGIISIKEQ